jgi:hypothetical protein
MSKPRDGTARDEERNYFAGAPAVSQPNKLLAPLAVMAALAAAWTIWSRGEATVARHASASRTTDAPLQAAAVGGDAHAAHADLAPPTHEQPR